MAQSQIEITMRGGEDHGGLMQYEPGAELRGVVQLFPDSDIRCNHLYVRLRWRTEGRGERDEGLVAEVDLFRGMLPARLPSAYEFRFTLPQQPWSYAGYYINIVWEALVELDVSWATNPRHSQPFIMAPLPGR